MVNQFNDDNGRAVPLACHITHAINVASNSVSSSLATSATVVRATAVANTYFLVGSPMTVAKAVASGCYLPAGASVNIIVGSNTYMGVSGGIVNVAYLE